MHCRLSSLASLVVLVLTGGTVSVRASLTAYDNAVQADAGMGLAPVATLTSAAVFTGANRAAFNFGANSGDVTIEFILEGNPAAIAGSGFLAVGTNTASSLRFEQWNNTGQLGFTQSGVVDYLFSPVAPSPTQPTHIAYVWEAATRTMRLYWNGSLAGTSSGASAAFAMPYGQGWLGANASGTETMVGTVHRVTVYDDLVPDAALQRHADAYNDIVRPPILVTFTATPDILFTPASATLAWNVQDALGIFIGGMDVTALPSLVVAPAATTTYTLVATNLGGSVTGRVTVVVNPGPVIDSFTAGRGYAAAGETIPLTWNVRYGQQYFLAPNFGDVTAQTSDGAGNLEATIGQTTTFTLAATSAFGTNSAARSVLFIQPAGHLVISEFKAESRSAPADEDGAFSDWIEVYNPTAGAINLSGHYLTDDKSDPLQWAFPNLALAGGGHLLVFASGKNRVNPLAPLHTNFQLDKAGEYLALIGPGPVVLQAFDPFPSQEENASYGVLGGDLATRRFLGVPTPGAANDITPAPPARVQFSRPGGTFLQPFAVALASDTPGAVLRYTTNGSMPSATNGLLYAAPIPVAGTLRVRAAAFGFGLASEVTGASYIKLGSDLAHYTSSLPLLVIENFGAGIIPQKGWSGTGAGIKQVPRQDAVWATFDRVDGASALTNGPQMISTVGLRGRGAFSSSWRQKPYSVEAMDESGGEREVSPLNLPAHADWVLYFPDPDNNKDPSLLFNTFAYELYRNSGHNGVRFRWVEVFVNEDGGELRLADRRGVYAIIEKVSRGQDRLDFQRLSEDGTNGTWLLNINRLDPEPETGWPAPNGATQPWFFHTAGPNRLLQSPPNTKVSGTDDEPLQSNGYLNFDNPTGHTINPNQRAAIENWFRQFEDVLWNNGLWRDPVNGYRKYLDPVDFADYFVLHTLTRNGDGLLISMFPWKGDDGRLRMGPAWDYNWSSYYVSGAANLTLWHRADRLWYKRLFADPDFYQLYLDRWWDHRRGAMSNAGMDAIIDGQMNEISPAKAVLNGVPSTTDWTNRLATMKTWLKDRASWVDGFFLRPPTFNQDGGPVPDGFQVTILGTNGTIYFTTDGVDPRVSGGAVAPSAQAFQLPFTIGAQTLVQARIKNGTNWSGLTAAVFYPPQDLTRLVLTEIMFNPPAFGVFSGDDVEFIELKNTGATPLQLGTLTFTTGITFTFTNGTQLAPGQFFVLARNPGVFAARYPGVPVNGVYSGRLDNSGETLRLAPPFGGTVLSVTYNDRAPWPVAADGHGFSAVPRGALAAPNSDDGTRWRASSAPGGSPGADDPASAVPAILVNEVLTHTDPPAVDWIELFNPTGSEVDLGGWFLSDDGAAPKKYRIPEGTRIPAGGFHVFTEAQFNAPPGSPFSFSLDSAGDAVYLSSGDSGTNLTGHSHGFAFGAAALDTTFGRYVNSVGDEQFPAQSVTSPHAANGGPSVGPVVLDEIMYHPDPAGDEFIELRNLMSFDVELFDIMRPTNTWRVNGLGYVFPTNLTLAANGRLLIVATNPAVFRAKHAVPAEVPVIGPFTGSLQDSGERLELQRPDEPDTNGTPYVTVDGVRYNDKLPWPPAADGSGASLQRRMMSAYGDDPVNWEAALPTPGGDFVPGQAPVITAQPQNQSVLSPGSAQFSASASGAAPLYFQWLFNSDPIAGATNALLLLTNIQPWQAGDYSLIAFNSAGSAASAAARLTVNRAPTILAQPTNQYVRPGFNAVFSVNAVGNGLLRYQWRFHGTNLLNATNATHLITGVQLANDGPYTVVITDNVGPAFSVPATLVVLIDPVVVEHPVSQSVVPGGPVTLSATVTNAATLPVGFRLRRNSVSLPDTFVTLQGRTVYFTLHPTNVQPPWTNYSIVATNRSSPSGRASLPAFLTYVIDTDGDGLPDEWESAHGLGTNDMTDAALDGDGDGMSNAREYIAGTDPADPLSYLKIDSIAAPPGATLTFGAVAARTYSVQFAEALGGAWSRLVDIPARPTNFTGTIHDPAWTTNRFYRLVTPQRP